MSTHLIKVRSRPHHARGWAIVAAMALAGTLSGCASRGARPRVTPEARTVPADATLRVETVEDGSARVMTIVLEDYVAGSVLSEVALGTMDALAAARVARLQAVLARTYAMANRGRHASEQFDLCSDTHCQLFRPLGAFPGHLQAIATAAAADTRGVVVVHGDRPIQALFHSDCGGHTSAAGLVWGGPTPPYLRAVPDDISVTEVHRSWQFVVEGERLRTALNRDSRTRVGTRLYRLDVVEQDVAGRAVRIVLDGELAPMVRGEELRAVLTRSFGPRAIRSTRFDVWRDGDTFVFEGRGFGHGVGLCQRGAIARAKAGQPLHTIIQHYYSGVRLDQLGSLRLTALSPPAPSTSPDAKSPHRPGAPLGTPSHGRQ